MLYGSLGEGFLCLMAFFSFLHKKVTVCINFSKKMIFPFHSAGNKKLKSRLVRKVR